MSDDLFDLTADVLVVGSGAAAYSAALTAASRGASVVMFESQGAPGGTTLLSGGTAWIPNNSLMREHGIEDPRDECLQFLCRLAYPQYYDPSQPDLGLDAEAYDLIAAFYDNGAAAIDHLRGLGAMDVEFDGLTPDYHGHLPEDRAPYGRRMPQKGGAGPMFARLESARERLGVRLLLNHRVQNVLRNEDGEVFGLEAHAGVRHVAARANKAVIFGSGGFLRNKALVRRHLAGRIFGGCAAPGSQGDFLRIAADAGAQMSGLHRAWWKQIVVEQALRSDSVVGLAVASGDAMVQVNKYGVRVVNEKAPYNERGQIHSAWDASRREYPNMLLFHIWDDACNNVEDFGWRMPLPPQGETDFYVISGDTLEELVDNIEKRLVELAEVTANVRLDPRFAQRLRETIARFNRFAESGVDEDFGRGTSPIELKWNGAGRGGVPNPTMAPFADHGPYYCAIIGGAAFDTNGGPRIDAHARVLAAGGSPIPGLYGAGNCVASITGQAYWGPGGTIGPALTFGHIAGKHAADEIQKRVVGESAT